MPHRHSRILAVVLASSLVVLAGLGSTVAAHDPGHGPGLPGTSAKPLPSGWAWPSDLKTAPARSHEPGATPRSQPSKSPRPTPTLTCPATPASIATSASATAPSSLGSFLSDLKGNWGKLAAGLYGPASSTWLKSYCAIDPLRKTLDTEISGRIGGLQDLIKDVAKSGLDASDQTQVDTELNSLIADLQTLKTKVDGETTLAALQADYQTLAGKGHIYRTVELWVNLLVSSEKLIAAGPALVTLESKIAAEIAAAPEVPETADAQVFLNDMKLAVSEGEGLAAPLPATLLAITPAELASGSADVTLSGADITLSRASWDLWLARWSAACAAHELKEATATPKLAPAPTATPT